MQLAARTGAWSGNPLPYKRRLAYLESHGTEYIDTGIPESNIDGVDFRFDSVMTAVAYESIFGGTNDKLDIDKSDMLSNRVRLWTQGWIGEYYLQEGENIFSIANGKVSLNGEIVKTISGTVSPFGNNIHIFGCASRNGCARVYSTKLFANGQELISLIPVLSLDDEPCMHDEVSGQLFRNAGTGTFGYGEVGTEFAGGGV